MQMAIKIDNIYYYEVKPSQCQSIYSTKNRSPQFSRCKNFKYHARGLISLLTFSLLSLPPLDGVISWAKDPINSFSVFNQGVSTKTYTPMDAIVV